MSIYQSLLCGVFNRTLRTKNSSQSVTDSQVVRILDPIFIFQSLCCAECSTEHSVLKIVVSL
jgi:hypothetical protein